MISTRLLCTTVVAMGLAPLLASASTFTFSYEDSSTLGTIVSVTGTLTGTAIGSNQFLITGITGTRNGAAITGLVAGGPSQVIFDLGGGDQFFYDNVLDMSGGNPYWDGDGLLYTVSGFSYPFNVFSSPGWYWELGYDGTAYTPNSTGQAITFTATAAVPEPPPMLLGLGGLAMIALFRRFRRTPAESR